MPKGRLITIEGCEGVGKSTQISLLKQYFLNKGKNVVFTREPGGTALGESIRNLILDPKNEMGCLTELMLYCAARSELIKSVIKPALDSGVDVICDRFIDSTTAYQGYARGLSLSMIATINEICLVGTNIDLTIWIDLDPIEGFKRKGGANTLDRMDSLSLDFHSRVYNGYKNLAKTHERICAIDGKQREEKIFADIIDTIRSKLGGI